MFKPLQNKVFILILICIPLLLNLSCKRRKTAEKPPAIPPGYEIHGIDVSHYQSHIDWEVVAKDKKVKFVFVKATEGINRLDRKFKTNWEGTKSNKIRRGAYHYFRPQFNGVKQAKFYLSVVNFEKGDLIPVLDLEEDPKGALTPFYKEIDAWLNTVELATGKKPILYTSRKFYISYLKARYPSHHLWVANYKTIKSPLNDRWKFWQYTEEAKISGIKGKVDHNVFNGLEKDLLQLCF